MNVKTSPTSMAANEQRAFTCTELLTVLAALVLLSAVVLPALANHRPRSQRVICANNLRQIGDAMHLWGNDHGDRPPQLLYPSEGGTRLHPLAPNVWLHFSWISNELVTPRVLLCPSDTGQPARDFSADHTGGYVHPNFANRATSYLLAHQGQLQFDPDKFMSGDRNVGGGSLSGSAVFGTAFKTSQRFTGRWAEGLHYPSGNVLRNDGQVQQLSGDAFTATFTPSSPALFEFILPR